VLEVAARDTAALLLQPHDNGRTAVLYDGIEPVFFPGKKIPVAMDLSGALWDNSQYYVVRLLP
jgi:hypothetical protein